MTSVEQASSDLEFAPPRFATKRNLERKTLGPAVARVAQVMGITLMPWQRYVLDIACEIDPTTGNFYYREIRLIVPRQQGKTVLLLVKALHRMLAWPRQRLVYTAQSRNMAKQRLVEDFYEPIAASPLAGLLDPALGKRDGSIGLRTQSGDEHMAFANKSRWRIDAPTQSAGHGPALDEGMIDEAFAHSDSRIETAMKPAQKTRRNAQLWVVSAAGDGDSTYLHEKVLDGRERVTNPSADDRVCYIEWSAPDEADADDPEVWRSCMPAWGITVFEDTIRAERGSMKDDDFRRSNLNQWRDRKTKPGAIPRDPWLNLRLEDDDDEVWVGTPTWALDISPARDVTSFTLAADSATDDRVFVELVGKIDGTEGVVEKMRELSEMFGGKRVAIGRSSAAASFGPKLTKAGFEVLWVKQDETADACGDFYDAVIDGSIAHLNDAELNAAIDAVKWRDYGDGKRIFIRKSLEDITPVYGVTFARWMHITQPPKQSYDVARSLG